jgi:hypothetical protein
LHSAGSVGQTLNPCCTTWKNNLLKIVHRLVSFHNTYQIKFKKWGCLMKKINNRIFRRNSTKNSEIFYGAHLGSKFSLLCLFSGCCIGYQWVSRALSNFSATWVEICDTSDLTNYGADYCKLLKRNCKQK